MQEIVDSGILGKLVSIEAKEALSFTHGASFMRRWHRWQKNNGGFSTQNAATTWTSSTVSRAAIPGM